MRNISIRRLMDIGMLDTVDGSRSGVGALVRWSGILRDPLDDTMETKASLLYSSHTS